MVIRLEEFGGGLNLSSGPLDPRFAIDCLDVLYGRAIRTRPGWAYLTSASNTYTCLKPYYETDGTKFLLAARSGNTDAISTAGATSATVAKTFTDAVSYGGPSAEAAYLANGSDTVFKFDGSSFSAPANMPEARYLAVQSPDNRLVAFGFTAGANGPSGSTVNESHVHFSDERAPETWTASSNVQLDPGDGEKIQGGTAWRNTVIIFKESHFYVFGGNSVDEDGNPVFNREKRTGAGLAAPQAYAVANEGVYFLDRTGVYLTNGGNAVRVSQNIDPIFGTDSPPFFTSGVVNQSAISGASMAYWGERLYVSLPMNGSSTNNRVLVYDPKWEWWSIYSIPAASLCVWRPSNSPELMFAHTGSKIARHSESYIADDSTAISAFSRTAWLDVQAERSLREIVVWGNGVVTASASVNYNPSRGAGVTYDLSSTSDTWGDGSSSSDTWGDGSSSSDLWGPGDEYSRQLYRGLGARGTVFSIAFSGSSATKPMNVEQASVNFAGGRKFE